MNRFLVALALAGFVQSVSAQTNTHSPSAPAAPPTSSKNLAVPVPQPVTQEELDAARDAATAAGVPLDSDLAKSHALPLFLTASFEGPPVKGRTPLDKGGTPVMAIGPREWNEFQIHQATQGGQLSAGMTNEIAHTGRQSLYFDFQNVTQSDVWAELGSRFIPIVAGTKYHISIWGRIDKKRPLALDQRAPMLRLMVEFVNGEKKTAVGKPIFKNQPIPGSAKRILFSAERWSEFYVEVAAPEGAAYMRLTWNVSTPSEAGVTDGAVFFDDANVYGQPGVSDEERAAKEATDATLELFDSSKSAPGSAPAPAVAAAPPTASPAEATPKPKKK